MKQTINPYGLAKRAGRWEVREFERGNFRVYEWRVEDITVVLHAAFRLARALDERAPATRTP